MKIDFPSVVGKSHYEKKKRRRRRSTLKSETKIKSSCREKVLSDVHF